MRSPSPEKHPPPSPGRPSQGLLLFHLPPGLAGALTGWAAALRPAPRCCFTQKVEAEPNHYLQKGLAHSPMQQLTSDRWGSTKGYKWYPMRRSSLFLRQLHRLQSAGGRKSPLRLVPSKGIPHRHRMISPATARGSPRSRQRHGHPTHLQETESGPQLPDGHFHESMIRPRKPPQCA